MINPHQSRLDYYKSSVTFLLLLCFSCSPKVSVTDYVDPFIGTAASGHTFPGATMPFGMVQLSPDTRNSGWDNCSGYHSSNPTILGFSHTHLSGTGAIDYGDILVMPSSGEIQIMPGDENAPETGYRSAFDHKTETAEPGYYAVTLDDDNIRAELTVSPRAGMHRYTFSSSEPAHILFDLQHGLGDNVIASSLAITGENKISGIRRSRGWAKDQYIFFTAEFSKPFDSFGIAIDDQFNQDLLSASGKNIKGVFTFNDPEGPLLVKVAISAVDIAGAGKNLAAEIKGWDFDYIRLRAQQAWIEELSVVTIKGGTLEEKTNFYTALYHSFIAPNTYQDVDGRYRGADLNIHTLPANENIYTVFSLWNTFRATHPLFTVLKPSFAEELVRTLLTKTAEGGLLPVWELAANETGSMIGYHSIPVIVDAFMKGLRNFDHEAALNVMVESAMQDHLGLDTYRSEGYIALEWENESVSKTLEYAYDDWCIAIMADDMGKSEIADLFYRRSLNYLNVFDAETEFMRGKKFGTWVTPFDPSEVNSIYTEANAWQYSFFIPHDINGMIEMMGGESDFSNKLDQLFTVSSDLSGRHQPDITGMIGQYAHGNESSYNYAYLYNYTGRAFKTQEQVRQIMDNLYTTGRDGLCGNEDCGQMSAWYIFSAIGFYPVTPGQDFYAIGVPLFEEVSLHLENGKSFTIKAPGASSDNKYIQSATLKNEDYSASFIKHADIMAGGVLEFVMGSTPNIEWGFSPTDRPFSTLKLQAVMNPTITNPARAFLDKIAIMMDCGTPGADIYYTLDGSTPSASARRYQQPITISQSTHVQAIAMKDGLLPSYIESVRYTKLPYDINITYHEPYSLQYTAGGNKGLFDSVRGISTAWGSWQGFYDRDFYGTIDLGKVRDIYSVTATFLQNADSWIWMPEEVIFEVSNDGRKFNKIDSYTHQVPLTEYEPTIMDFKAKLAYPVRYIRIRGKTIGVCPEWHPGSGNPSWVFIDEIVIE